MAEHDIEPSDLLAGTSLELSTGENHTIIVGRKVVYVVEFADTLFRTNSAVPLPVASGPVADSSTPTALDATATALIYADQEDVVCSVAGHTDTVGGDEANFRLSRLRAEAVKGLLCGDRDAFANACWGPHLTEEQRYPNGGSGTKAGVLWLDYADVLNWIAASQDWLCVTGYPHKAPWLYDATVAFQKSYNASAVGHGKTVDVTGRFDKATWGAVYDCFELGLAEILEVDLDGLKELRKSIKVPRQAAPLVACGEKRPVDHAGRDNYDSLTNRRAEILFFLPGHEPVLPCGGGTCRAASCELCNPLLFKRERIDLSVLNSDTLPQMNLWLLDHLGQRMGANPASPDPLAQSLGACYRLVLPSGAARCGYADADGMVTEYNFPSNVLCLLQWGKREDAIWDGSAMDDDEAEEFFIYSETIFIGLEPPSRDLSTCQLSNLGYEGVATECRQRFAADYGSSMESEIFNVHGSGRPKNSA